MISLKEDVLPILRAAAMPLVAIVHTINAAIATFYVYAIICTLVSAALPALLFSLLMGISNLIIILLLAYNNLRDKQQDVSIKPLSPAIHTLLVIVIVAALALHTLSNFISPYVSLGYLGAALSLPIHAGWSVGIIVGVAVLTTIAFLLFDLVQLIELYNLIEPNKPAPLLPTGDAADAGSQRLAATQIQIQRVETSTPTASPTSRNSDTPFSVDCKIP